MFHPLLIFFLTHNDDIHNTFMERHRARGFEDNLEASAGLHRWQAGGICFRARRQPVELQ
jgi:hypothetical protein